MTTTPYINTFDNKDNDPQFLVEIAPNITLLYYGNIRQVAVLNESGMDISWMGSGEATGSNGVPVLFSFPAVGGDLPTIKDGGIGYFSTTGGYSQAFNVTVTNQFVTLKDVEIKVVEGPLNHLYHFNLNNTCLEGVNTIQISPISETTY